MRVRGKYSILWEITRQEWIDNNPPNHEGYYTCWICNKWVKADEMELDHIISRSRRPDLRFEQTNLAPSHHKCNTDKGSKKLVKPTKSFPQEDDNIWGNY